MLLQKPSKTICSLSFYTNWKLTEKVPSNLQYLCAVRQAEQKRLPDSSHLTIPFSFVSTSPTFTSLDGNSLCLLSTSDWKHLKIFSLRNALWRMRKRKDRQFCLAEVWGNSNLKRQRLHLRWRLPTDRPKKDFCTTTGPCRVFQDSVQVTKPKAQCFSCALNGISARLKRCRSRDTVFFNK